MLPGLRLCAAPLLALFCAACSIAVPTGGPAPLWRNGVDADDATGSVPKPPATLSPALDAEDWRRASAAMATALDPQGSGDVVRWDNPDSGAKGSIIPSGPAFPKDGKVCRAFHAELATKETHENIEGAACREKTADWALAVVSRKKA